ncbi:MAG: response regulator, partial [Bacteroidota bacterium]
LESEKEKGSTFYIVIPYKPGSISNTQNASTIKILDAKKTHTILIAEDEEINYLYIETLFEKNIQGNFSLLHAKNGKEAVDICHKNTDICLVLMDIKMPLMNGYEATKKIKSEFPNLPIIAQTAYSTESDKTIALSHGCDDFISKPIRKEMLFEIVKKHI